MSDKVLFRANTPFIYSPVYRNNAKGTNTFKDTVEGRCRGCI